MCRRVCFLSPSWSLICVPLMHLAAQTVDRLKLEIDARSSAVRQAVRCDRLIDLRSSVDDRLSRVVSSRHRFVMCSPRARHIQPCGHKSGNVYIKARRSTITLPPHLPSFSLKFALQRDSYFNNHVGCCTTIPRPLIFCSRCTKFEGSSCWV